MHIVAVGYAVLENELMLVMPQKNYLHKAWFTEKKKYLKLNISFMHQGSWKETVFSD